MEIFQAFIAWGFDDGGPTNKWKTKIQKIRILLDLARGSAQM